MNRLRALYPLSLLLAGLLGAGACLAGVAPPVSGVTTNGRIIPAMGWKKVDDMGTAVLQGTLQLCNGQVWHESSGPVCRAASTRFTRPTLFGFARALPGEVLPWTAPQKWLDAHTDTPASHHLVYTGFSGDAAGVVWVFYNVLPPNP
jgi:hypothetical protein